MVDTGTKFACMSSGAFGGFRNGNFGFRSGIFALCAYLLALVIGHGELGGQVSGVFSTKS